MLNVWTQNSGFNFGTFQENTILNIALPINTTTDVNYKLISGKLPDGLRLENSYIKGTPKEVILPTTYKFCIRASKLNQISDRTFFIKIEGADDPVIVTEEGLLSVGPNQTYFVLDRTPIDFQIDAYDFDIEAGQELKFFINRGEGELPPGLVLEKNGRIHGLVDPLLSVFISDRNGGYDTVNFDLYGYDYGIKSDNGYDSFNYDMTTYDYFATLKAPKKLNRNYEFIINVTDGYTVARRKFRIYVVGEDFLKSDNTIIKAGTSFYRADNTDLRAPIWITTSDLGILRSNNYHIIKLDLYDMIAYGPILYYLEPKVNKNDPNSPNSQLPPGMKLDIKSGEVFGIIPFQSETIKSYTFTVTATRFGRRVEFSSVSKTFTVRILGEIDSTMSWVTPNFIGVQDVNQVCDYKIEAQSTLALAQISYSIVQGQLPLGLKLESNGEITGKIKPTDVTTFYDTVNGLTVNNLTFDNGATSFDKIYKFIVRAQDQSDYSAIDREFSIEVGTPDNKLFSNIYTTSYMTIDKRRSFNDFINNENIFPRKLIYRPDDSNFGIRKDLRMLMFAGIETRDADEYISMIGLNHKRKRFRFGEVKTAKAKVPGTNNIVYEIVYVQMVDHQDFKDERLPISLSIDDFTKRNLEAKIPLDLANNRISADASNYIWKTQEQDFYVSDKEPYLRRPLETITIDRTDLQVSDFRSKNRYPNTYTNWRRRIKGFMLNNGIQVANQPKYLPLWMRSFQDNRQEIGFTLALPLCYCLAGTSSEIALNIKNSSFDFKQLDYTVDRYIIDTVNGYGQDKFLVFKDKEVVV